MPNEKNYFPASTQRGFSSLGALRILAPVLLLVKIILGRDEDLAKIGPFRAFRGAIDSARRRQGAFSARCARDCHGPAFTLSAAEGDLAMTFCKGFQHSDNSLSLG